MITGLSGRTYEEKLAELDMTTLREQRAKIDMIQTYKIINKVDDVQTETWFNLVSTVDRATRNTVYTKNIVLSRSKTETERISSQIESSWKPPEATGLPRQTHFLGGQLVYELQCQ